MQVQIMFTYMIELYRLFKKLKWSQIDPNLKVYSLKTGKALSRQYKHVKQQA